MIAEDCRRTFENNEADNNNNGNYGPSVEDVGWIPKLFEKTYRTTQLVFTKKNGKTFTCLRQPRDIYALSKLTIPLNIRWPSEVQMYSQRPYHILYTPLRPEPLHKRGKDTEHLDKTANVFGKVVYDNSPDPEMKYFVNSKTDGRSSSSPQPYYNLKDENDKTLLFESRFESGNLMRAIKVGEYDYQLWLKFDLYTKKNTQWFYFQIKNALPNINYRFTIMNFLKSGSLYNEGMKPLLYSEKDAKEKKIGWIRAGTNIRYYKNDIRIEENKERSYYSLHWKCTFNNENDIYYFAHSYPYTYSDLQEYLVYLSSDPHRRKCCKQRVLCQTLAGNHIYILTITAPTRCPKQAKIKRVIVITARVHPGETIASWMMKGLLDYLTSNEPDAKVLRETFIFKIIPMLNPDGVIVGNYRCSLAGRDLNRNYKTVLKDSFPPVWTMKYLVKKLQEEREISLYCDFHGHSRKKNIFIYGCENKQEQLDKRLSSRLFPYILSKNAPDKFSFSSCRFRVQKSKEGTGRVVMWNQGIKYSYTLEASFCGSSGEYHFGVQDYEAMGYHLCDSLLDLFDPDLAKLESIQHEIKRRVHSTILKKMISNGELEESDIDTDHMQFFSDLETESYGSDSSVSDGLPMQLLHVSIPELTKKKRLKSRKERNKSRKHQTQKRNTSSVMKPTTSRSPPVISSPREQETRPRPNKESKQKTKLSRKTQSLKMTYTSRDKNKDCRKCSSSSHGTVDSNEYLDSVTHSYVQAGLIDHSVKSCHKQHEHSLSPPCGRCNPAYHLTFDTSDGETDTQNHNANYSLFEIRMPNNNTELNPTLELARRITAFNYRHGKVPTRVSKTFAIWSNDEQKREELLRRQTVNQGDNLDYLTRRLKNVRNGEFLQDTKSILHASKSTTLANVTASIETQENSEHSLHHNLLNDRISNITISSRKMGLPGEYNETLSRSFKYLPKLKNSIKKQPATATSISLNDIDNLKLPMQTNTFSSVCLEPKKTSAMTPLIPSPRKVCHDLKDVLVTRDSSLLPDSKPKTVVGAKITMTKPVQLKSSINETLKLTDIVTSSSEQSVKGSSSQSSTEENNTIQIRSSGRGGSTSPERRAITPQQYCMYYKNVLND